MSSTISPEDLGWLQDRIAGIFTNKPNPTTEGAGEVILAARRGSLKPSDAPLACRILTDAGEVLTPNLKKYVESLKPVEQPAADDKVPDVKQPPVKDVVKPNVPPEQNQKSSGQEPGESKDKAEIEDDDVGEAQQSEDTKHQDPDIPQALRSADHWVLTSNRYGVNIFGEAYPLHPETGETITWKHPDFWMTYDQAVDALKQNRHNNLDGLGFVVARDGAEPSIIGGTINCCRDPDTGQISEWVDKFLKELNCPYCLSITGTGLHFFCHGTLPHDAFLNAPDDLTDEMKAHIIAKKPDIKTQIANGKKVWNEVKIFSNNTQHLALTDTWLGAVDLEDRAEVLQGLIKPCLEMGKIFKNKLVDEAALPSEDVMKKAREDALRLMHEALLEGNESAWAKPENVKLLKFLKEYDRETYYSVMTEWKRILPTCEIKKIVNDEIRDEKQDDPKPNPAKRVVDAIVGAEFELWHSKNGLGFITINGTHMTIRDATFANYLTTTYYNEMDDVLSPIPLKAAVETLHGMAMNEDRPEYEVVTRIALCGEVIYLDMANKDNEVIEVSKDGWRIREGAPVRFRRPDGLLPLPRPEHVEDPAKEFDELFTVVNCYPEKKILVKGWEIGTLNPTGAYPVFVIKGEPGSGKSVKTKRMKQITDPSNLKIEELRKDKDLIITCFDNHIAAFDNISYLQQARSDMLCRVSTGAGFRQRLLYTNMESVQTTLRNPLILNGLEEFVTQGDLSDRCIYDEMPPAPEPVVSEETLNKTFTEIHPKVLGALLEYAVRGLKARAEGKKPKISTRMSDFGEWVVLCLGDKEGEEFADAYVQNKNEELTSLAEGNPFLTELFKLMEREPCKSNGWEGTSTMLLTELTLQAHFIDRSRPYGFPINARALSSALNKFGKEIANAGLRVERPPSHKVAKIIKISHVKKPEQHPEQKVADVGAFT